MVLQHKHQHDETEQPDDPDHGLVPIPRLL
jgi:hypothetical protein